MQANAQANINGISDNNDIFIKNNILNTPDIYFIILDEYAGPSQMKSYFSYDMSPFIEHLKQKGFMVTEMKTKYLSTDKIMQSVLNMEEGKYPGTATSSSSSFSSSLYESTNMVNSIDKERLISIRNAKAIRFLKKIGYQFINMGSWYHHTRYNRLADKNVNNFGFQFSEELPTIIVNNSVLRLVSINRYFHRTAVLDTFSALESMHPDAGKPKFVFAHILCPHTPFVFGGHGETIGVRPNDGKDGKGRYLDQHIFITKKVTELVDHINLTSQRPPVIVIKADHGVRMDRVNAHKVFTAVYLPDYKGEPWPDSLSSYNTFLLIFNYLWGTNLEIHG